jgi:hypothetical protein
MAKQVSTSDIIKQLKARNKGGKFKSFKESEDTFGSPLPDGGYEAQVTEVKLGLTKNNDPYVMFKLKVTAPEDYENRVVTKLHTIAEKGQRTLDVCYQMLGVDFQRLGYDVSEIEQEEALVDLCKEITSDKPLIKLGVTTDEKSGYQRQNFLGVLEDQEGQEEEPNEEEEGQEEEEAVEETQEEEYEEVEEETPPPPPRRTIKKSSTKPPALTTKKVVKKAIRR